MNKKNRDALAGKLKAPLATPTDLSPQATKDISAALNAVLADVFALYLKTKNFHWHVSGPHFRHHHLLLDEPADHLLGMTDARIVLTTIDDIKSAERLGRQLVELRLAACVNIVEHVHSVYRWQGEIETANEILIIIKTTAQRIPALKEKFAQLHPYDVPEFVVLQVTDGSDPYLAWLLAGSRDNTD